MRIETLNKVIGYILLVEELPWNEFTFFQEPHKNQPNGNIGDQNKGKGNQGAEKQNQKNEPQDPNDPNKIPKDLQKLILQRSANQERETAKKLLNKNGYYSPESNTKDW
jgi:hypothetical protein